MEYCQDKSRNVTMIGGINDLCKYYHTTREKYKLGSDSVVADMLETLTQ